MRAAEVRFSTVRELNAEVALHHSKTYLSGQSRPVWRDIYGTAEPVPFV
jgi:hypothetical protein